MKRKSAPLDVGISFEGKRGVRRMPPRAKETREGIFRTCVRYPIVVEHKEQWQVAIYFPFHNGNWWVGRGATLRDALRSVFGQIEVYAMIAKDWGLLGDEGGEQ